MAKAKTHMNGIIKKVPLGKMRLGANGQRILKPAWVKDILTNMDLEQLGLPELNFRDPFFYILDGQHRFEALKQWLGEGWQAQQIECRVYEGMSERQEANKIHALNKSRLYTVYDAFQTAFIAGHPTETAICAIVERLNLCISRDKVPGAIGAVGTLIRIYNRSDDIALRKALRIIRDSFGDVGFEAQLIDGIGHLCQRYDGVLDEKVAVDRLSVTRGGVKGLLGKAEAIHRKTGTAKAQCVAAAAVEIINQGRGRKKLPSWWRTE